MPKVGSIPFFLTYFWQIQAREVWPIYYTNAVQTMTDLNIWQPALTPDSYTGWLHTRVQSVGVRPVPFVEIMMPFFRWSALKACLPSFTETESGWGIDFLWPKMVHNEGIAVFDSLTATHCRPIQSENWKLSNGKTPLQEGHELAEKYNLRGSQYGRFDRNLFDKARETA